MEYGGGTAQAYDCSMDVLDSVPPSRMMFQHDAGLAEHQSTLCDDLYQWGRHTSNNSPRKDVRWCGLLGSDWLAGYEMQHCTQH